MPASARTRQRQTGRQACNQARHQVRKPAGLGALPEWNLADLYSGIDDPKVKRDLDRADTYSVAFEEDFKGKLAALADLPDAGAKLAHAVVRYEQLDDLLGRLISFAGLVHAGNTIDPVRAKFYGDVQERITAASTHLLFFQLELNRLDDAKLDAAMADPKLGHYRPWLEDIRKDKPYQLEDRIEQLFHEKSVTAYSAWNRLFDETIARAALQGRRQVARHRADAELDAGSEREEPQGGGAGAGQDVQGQSAAVRARHQHARQGQGDFRPLARLRRRGGFAAPVEPRRARGGRRAGRRRCAPPIRGSRTATTRSRRAGSARSGSRIGTATRRCRRSPTRTIGWSEAQATVLTAYGAFSSEMAAIAEKFFKNNWIDAPVRPGKAPGAFAHPTVPSAHPYVLLNYQGKPRDVMTLAHELGHGVHQVLAAPNGPLMAPTPLTLAETASVFGEMLTFKKLLAGRRPQSSARPCSPPRSRT